MCKCITQVNEELAKKGCKLALSFDAKGKEHIQIVTQRKEGKGRPVMLFASYCPFCGEKVAYAN